MFNGSLSSCNSSFAELATDATQETALSRRGYSYTKAVRVCAAVKPPFFEFY